MDPRPLVLACEDEERIVELLRALTEPLGVDLVAAKDGASALAHLAARRPTLMTLDLVLPNLDGFGVLERIRQRRDLDELPIIVISAIADGPTIKRAYGLGVVDFVAKPFNVDMLEAKLRIFLRMQRLADEGRARQSFLHEVVDRLSSSLLVVDAELRVVEVNRAACALIGRDAASLMGQLIADVLPGAEPLFAVTGDRAQRRGMLPTTRGPCPVGFTNAAVPVAGRRGALALLRELAEVESARRDHDEERREASAAKSFAHEVRNPLAAISAAAQVIARPACDDAQRLRLARAIDGEAGRVLGLVQEYVERREVQPPTGMVDVRALLHEVVEVNLMTSPARTRITVTTDPSLPSVRADGARLKQVLLNLVLNAIQATEGGGAIALEARPDAGGVALRVSDTGCGIAIADLPRIFDESYSTRQGGGLGLPIARRIVELHGGAIRVESVAGRGSTFTVWLPAL